MSEGDAASAVTSVTVTYPCAACGNPASTLTLIPPGEPDPNLTPTPPGLPPGIGSLLGQISPESGQLSIAGGPVSVSMFVDVDWVAAALATRDPAALYAIDFELAPFWCPKCAASYCGDHYRTVTVYDEGYFDCIRGTCPAGHERMLED